MKGKLRDLSERFMCNMWARCVDEVMRFDGNPISYSAT